MTLIACSLLAVILAYAFYRALMQPLTALTEGAQAISSGQLEQRIVAKGPRELAALAVNFNDMAANLSQQRTALRQANERLEETVLERTRELREKAKRLTEIDRSRRLFFAMVGHELRTPLSIILGEAELAEQLSNEDAATPQRSALSRILVDGRFLQRRITDLLTVARSEEGRLELDLAPLALKDLLEEVKITAQTYAQQNDVMLLCELTSDDALIRGDGEWLRQGILTLVDNAIKHAVDAGEVFIHLKATSKTIKLSISDNGPGVKEEYIPTLFDPFYKSDHQGAVTAGGVGLGLAVAKWISVSHDAEISARNLETGGFEVQIEFPRLATQY
ncbi:MAG: HAMP domain-containing sensor histidine kinase [Pseudomonadota bacterium]